MTEINSEQELLKMKEEGRITEKEYAELLSEIRKNPAEAAKSKRATGLDDERKRKLGIISLALSIAGIFLPLLFYGILLALTAGSNARPRIDLWFILCLMMELVALVLGVIGWRTEFGKAGAIISGLLIALCIGSIILIV